MSESTAVFKRLRLRERSIAPVALVPSVLVFGLFVYGFIAATGLVSLSNWNTAKIDLSLASNPLGSYEELLGSYRFQCDLRNTFVFTILLLIGTILLGLALAILLETAVRGRRRTVFRQLFLFPYSLSFIVTGVAWRWIFNPETGINLLINATGVNHVLAVAGIGPLQPGWLTDPQVVLPVNNALASVFPPLAAIQTQLGIPVALIPVTIASMWQLGGFAMAMFLAGLSTIPEEVREAARIDGATEAQIYRRIVLPMLRPIMVSIIIIVGASSLKIFDLIVGMSGVGPGFATDVPGLFVYDMAFGAQRYNLGAAASLVMLLLVTVVVLPYLARSLRNE
jgi:glucose/mannose transport system permease protein